ncbi:MAG: endonuclease domain-containing protein [Patescibacteria group bacterium]
MRHALTKFARTLRKKQTDTEAKLWQYLRAGRFGGVKFYRQYPIGNYIVDFCAPKYKLIVEVDGSGHDEPDQRVHDAERDMWLQSEGWKTIRVWNNEIASDITAVLEKIQQQLPPLPAFGHPLPPRERDI